MLSHNSDIPDGALPQAFGEYPRNYWCHSISVSGKRMKFKTEYSIFYTNLRFFRNFAAAFIHSKLITKNER